MIWEIILDFVVDGTALIIAVTGLLVAMRAHKRITNGDGK